MSCSPCGNTTPLFFNTQSFLNPGCSDCNDSQCHPSKNVCYTGPNLPCSGILTNDDLEVVFTKIDQILCSNTGNYSTYQMNCLPAAFGSAITTEAQFVNAITSYACSIKTTSNTFITNTFPTYQTIINNRFLVIETPAVVCASAGILVGDTLTNVYTKYCSKFTSIDVALNISDILFNTCFTVTVPPTTVKQGFAEVISQICQVKAIATANGVATLPTFNNVGTCLAAPLTVTDTLQSTVIKLRDKVCTLPVWDYTTSTWGCVGAPASNDLGAGIQKILTKVNYMLPKVVTFGAGFTVAQTNVSDPCDGVTVSVSATTDRFVAATSLDTTPSTLDNKLLGAGITIDSTTTAGKITLINDYKIKASASDAFPNFLINKLVGSSNNGISITPVYNTITKMVELQLSVDSSTLCALLGNCAGLVPCTGYTITPSGTSPLSYTDCNGAVVSIASISGVTSVCAKLNTVYAPNATVVNTGICGPTNTPLFSVINDSTDIVVTDVLTGGLRFYTISSGSYVLNPGAFISGVGNTSGIVSVLTSAGTGVAKLFKNEVLQQTIALSGGGVYPFAAVVHATGDDMKIVIDPTNLFSINNLSTDVTVNSVDTASGSFNILTIGSYPVAPSGIVSGVGTTSLAVRANLTRAGAVNRVIALYKNSILQQSLAVTGTAVFTFSPVIFSPGDFMLISVVNTLA